MKDGICPKCGSDEVYVKHMNVGRGTGLPVGSWWRGPAPLDSYVCASCGYVESYVSSEYTSPFGDVVDSLRYISEHWDRADGQPKSKRKRGE